MYTLFLKRISLIFSLSLSAGTVKVKSSGIQVGDLIIVEKVGLLISSLIVRNGDLLANGISYFSML